MKTFINAEIVEVSLADTAFGPNEPNKVDVEKYSVTDNDGNVIGYKAKFGSREEASQQA